MAHHGWPTTEEIVGPCHPTLSYIPSPLPRPAGSWHLVGHTTLPPPPGAALKPQVLQQLSTPHFVWPGFYWSPSYTLQCGLLGPLPFLWAPHPMSGLGPAVNHPFHTSAPPVTEPRTKVLAPISFHIKVAVLVSHGTPLSLNRPYLANVNSIVPTSKIIVFGKKFPIKTSMYNGHTLYLQL